MTALAPIPRIYLPTPITPDQVAEYRHISDEEVAKMHTIEDAVRLAKEAREVKALDENLSAITPSKKMSNGEFAVWVFLASIAVSVLGYHLGRALFGGLA